MVQGGSSLILHNMCLQQTIAENYFVPVNANFTVPKIQNSECQAGFEALHKTV